MVGHSERGSASAQVVLVTPVLMLAVLLVLQFALYEHASHVVTAAAQHGATSAQLEGGSVATGRDEALRFLGRTDRGLLRDPRVEVSRDGYTARVVVRAGVVSLLPGFSFAVHGAADGPSERFRGRTER